MLWPFTSVIRPPAPSSTTMTGAAISSGSFTIHPGFHRRPRRPLWRKGVSRLCRRLWLQRLVAADPAALGNPDRHGPSGLGPGGWPAECSRLDRLLPGFPGRDPDHVAASGRPHRPPRGPGMTGPKLPPTVTPDMQLITHLGYFEGYYGLYSGHSSVGQSKQPI